MIRNLQYEQKKRRLEDGFCLSLSRKKIVVQPLAQFVDNFRLPSNLEKNQGQPLKDLDNINNLKFSAPTK